MSIGMKLIRKNRFVVRRLADGRAMLNLACGSRMHPAWNNLDFSPLVRLARYRRLAGVLKNLHFLSEKRYQRLLAVDPSTICWDLRKGIPFPDNTFEVVYHSHFLEHLDRSVACSFLKDCHRVLKNSGVLRVVVPDLGIRCRNYVETLTMLSRTISPDPVTFDRHKENIRRLLEQIVRSECAATARQPFVVRKIERFFRGDAAKAGDIHRWMYDQHTLAELFTEAGFEDVRATSPGESRVSGWSSFGLDTADDSSVSKRDSIYLEGTKIRVIGKNSAEDQTTLQDNEGPIIT